MSNYSTEANGNRKHEASSVKSAAVDSASKDIQGDVQALQQDIATLSQQLASLVATKGGEAWKVAKDNLDGVLGDVTGKGKEAADAVGDVRDNLAAAIDESIDKRPYTTLAMTLAAGFVLGAMWKR